MGVVLLIRHGQASWGEADYDVLSPLGEEQSATVGRVLTGLRPDLVLHGTMQRQRRTAEIAAATAGWTVPLTVDERWNEMDHLSVLAAQPKSFEGEPDRTQFQAWFEAATTRWTSGENDDAYDESFPDFRARVATALDGLADTGTVVVVTSGGPISSAACDLLGAGTETYTRMAPVVVNTSVTRVVSGRRGLTLVSFNDHQHLPEELLTYR